MVYVLREDFKYIKTHKVFKICYFIDHKLKFIEPYRDEKYTYLDDIYLYETREFFKIKNIISMNYKNIFDLKIDCYQIMD